jgi:pyruvate formate lyase activating enzyme
MKEAMFYRKMGRKNVKCCLCPRNCLIADGKTGFCKVRQNHDGKLFSVFYGRPCSVAIDPIEKKPFFHFAPGSQTLSIAFFGCNLSCSFCQNWQISQKWDKLHGEHIQKEIIEPEKIVRIALENNSAGISYTYTEPTVFFEYAFETMKLAKKAGLYNTWVSNGYTSPEVIKTMVKYLDAVNVDLKGDEKFYREMCNVTDMKPVLESLKLYKKYGVWVEATNLLVLGKNDSDQAIKKIVDWVKECLGTNYPLHFSAYYPHYKYKKSPPTSAQILDKAYEIAKKAGIKYVYSGNIPGHPNESTYCPKCGTKVIEREGFSIISFREKCPRCGTKINLKWVKRNFVYSS